MYFDYELGPRRRGGSKTQISQDGRWWNFDMSKVFQSPSLRALSGVFSGALSVVPSSLPSDVFIFVSFALSYA